MNNKFIKKKDNRFGFDFSCGKANIALELDGYYVWDCSVIAAKGRYYMFASRWKEELGFGWNWLFNSEVCRFVSDQPQGPYRFDRVVLPRRGRGYFDGMNTHNTCVKFWNGKYYLYYMGTTYGGEIPTDSNRINEQYAMETWNRKRIGVAVADDIDADFIRCDEPLLTPRDCSHWDCTITTNPSVAILPSGKTYMIYKSRRAYGKPLQLGVAVADKLDGKFERLTDTPILAFADENKHMEDPFLWYDEKRKKFCIIAKDDSKNGDRGITGEWGSTTVFILKLPKIQKCIPVRLNGKTEEKPCNAIWNGRRCCLIKRDSPPICSVRAATAARPINLKEKRTSCV